LCERTGGCWVWPCPSPWWRWPRAVARATRRNRRSPRPRAEQSPGADGSGQDGSGQDGKPNTKDIPEVVAEVNGEKITKDDFVPLFETQYQQMQAQAQQSGQPVDEKDLKKQTAENLVSTEVLTQEADKRKISVSDKDIDKALKESAQSGQMSEKDFPVGHEGSGHGREEGPAPS
jgi:hypothetical protein